MMLSSNASKFGIRENLRKLNRGARTDPLPI
jgi:hypothetical protein